jgi:hypothetical protein
MTPRDRTAEGRFRILAVVDETVEPAVLHHLILDHNHNLPTDVLVVCPGLDSEDHARHCVERLQLEGIPSHGWAGHPDPRKAIAAALVVFEADEVLMAG